jgi:hypothetical protein
MPLVLAGIGRTVLRWGRAGGTLRTMGEVLEFLVLYGVFFHEMFDMGMLGGATWPTSARVLRLLPDTGNEHEREVGKNPDPLMPELDGSGGLRHASLALVVIEWAEELFW